MPSPPEPTELRAERAARAPGGHDELRARPPHSRLRTWLVQGIRSRRPRLATAKPAVPTLADLWNAWAVAELECAIALRAWQLAPRRDKRGPYEAYRGALDREALIAGELRLRIAP